MQFSQKMFMLQWCNYNHENLQPTMPIQIIITSSDDIRTYVQPSKKLLNQSPTYVHMYVPGEF